MLYFALYFFFTCIIGILGICYFFLNNTENDSTEEEEKKSQAVNGGVNATGENEKEIKNDKSEKCIANQGCLCEKVLDYQKVLNEKVEKIIELQESLKEVTSKSHTLIVEAVSHDVMHRLEARLNELMKKYEESMQKFLNEKPKKDKDKKTDDSTAGLGTKVETIPYENGIFRQNMLESLSDLDPKIQEIKKIFEDGMEILSKRLDDAHEDMESMTAAMNDAMGTASSSTYRTKCFTMKSEETQ